MLLLRSIIVRDDELRGMFLDAAKGVQKTTNKLICVFGSLIVMMLGYYLNDLSTGQKHNTNEIVHMKTKDARREAEHISYGHRFNSIDVRVIRLEDKK